jgi:NAD(P)-dependent dehydrogenase (short-subunit alcohol dehydrogenase family)
MSDANNKVIIVTGANAGIGRETARGLAKAGHTVIMVCRNVPAGVQVREEIVAQTGKQAVTVMKGDLSSQQSIHQFAADFTAQYPRLDVLINNPANFDHTLKKPTLTEDGVEVIFATNHLGPFLLTNLLLERLKTSVPARVLTVASQGLMTYPFLSIEFDNLNGRQKFSAQHAYYHSKIAQVMFTFDLAQRLQGTGVTVNCIRVSPTCRSTKAATSTSPVGSAGRTRSSAAEGSRPLKWPKRTFVWPSRLNMKRSPVSTSMRNAMK